jgi:hypothetical protein
MPNFEGAVNPLERRGPTVIQLLLQELSGYEHQTLEVWHVRFPRAWVLVLLRWLCPRSAYHHLCVIYE